MRAIPILLAATLASISATASADPFHDAISYLDRAAPLHCEVLTMQYRAYSFTPGAEREQASTDVYRRAAEVDQVLAAETQRFEAARATLTPQQRETLDRHGAELMRECSNKAAATYHVQLPALSAAPSVPSGPSKVAPYRSGSSSEKTLRAQRQPAAIQGQPPSAR